MLLFAISMLVHGLILSVAIATWSGSARARLAFMALIGLNYAIDVYINFDASLLPTLTNDAAERMGLIALCSTIWAAFVIWYFLRDKTRAWFEALIATVAIASRDLTPRVESSLRCLVGAISCSSLDSLVFPAINDTEVKILEEAARRSGVTQPGVYEQFTGRIDLYNERIPCPLCGGSNNYPNGVIQQFRQMFPNIELNAFQPCTEQEIHELEQQLERRLPAVYREFLLTMGHDAGELLQADDCFYEDLPKIQRLANVLLAQNHVATPLPVDAFVVYYAGYQFFFFRTSEGDDPPVYYYLEGDESISLLPQTYEHYTDFLATAIEEYL